MHPTDPTGTDAPSRDGSPSADARRAAGTEDRRQDRRVPVHCAIRVRLRTEEIVGQADNVSGNGVLFVSQDPLRVTVEFEEDGVVKRMEGRLVRGQRMRGESVAWAVELD